MSKIKFKRGYKDNLPKSLPIGEPAFCLDTCELYIGSGINKPLIKVCSQDFSDILSLISSLDDKKVNNSELTQIKAQLNSIVVDNADGSKDNELLMLRTDVYGKVYPSANERIDHLESLVYSLSTRVNSLEEKPQVNIL